MAFGYRNRKIVKIAKSSSLSEEKSQVQLELIQNRIPNCQLTQPGGDALHQPDRAAVHPRGHPVEGEAVRPPLLRRRRPHVLLLLHRRAPHALRGLGPAHGPLEVCTVKYPNISSTEEKILS